MVIEYTSIKEQGLPTETGWYVVLRDELKEPELCWCGRDVFLGLRFHGFEKSHQVTHYFKLPKDTR